MTLQVSNSHNQITLKSDAVKEFLYSVESARPDLKWIQDTASALRQGKHMFRRDLVDTPFGLFDEELQNQGDEYLQLIDSGDTWYKNFRERECEASNNHQQYCYDNQVPTNFDSWLKESLPIESPNSNNAKNLYEEAQYEKLSKFEQEENELAPVVLDDHVTQTRHVVDPLHEIKLKISQKMVNQGMSPALPSDLYAREHGSQSMLDPEAKNRQTDLETDQKFESDPKAVPNLDIFKYSSDDDLNLEEDLSPDELLAEYDDIIKEVNGGKPLQKRKLMSVQDDSEKKLQKQKKIDEFKKSLGLDSYVTEIVIKPAAKEVNSTEAPKNLEQLQPSVPQKKANRKR